VSTHLVVSVERQIDQVPPRCSRRLAPEAARVLLDSGEYDESVGLAPGRHFRKARGVGCYHLRIHEGRADLHWDEWDPRRYPVQHFFEVPELWIPAAAVAVLAVTSR
jgi:hypothetical protein